MGLFKWIAVALVAVAAQRYFAGPTMAQLRATPKQHKWETLSGIWDEADQGLLDALVLESSPYVTFAKDVTSPANVGEAQPAVNGSCLHPYLIPDSTGEQCVLPSRIDIARHYLKTGGVSGRKEGYDSMASRIQGFSRFFHSHHGDTEHPAVQRLFESDMYQKKAAEVCEGNTVFDPMQLGIIMQLPGQEVPTHYDVPWFSGATRFTLPQWLLVVMDQSGLFASKRLPQVQGVAYLHRWEPSEERGGGFFFYPEGAQGPMEVFEPEFNSAIVVDGAVVIHGTIPYKRDAAVPFLDKSKKVELVHDEEKPGEWFVRTEGQVLQRYTHDDLRISLVWRQRCFESEEAKEQWHAINDFLTVDEVLDVLVRDLRAHGRLGDTLPEPLDLAMLLMDEYAPLPQTSPLDVNVCMLPRVLPPKANELIPGFSEKVESVFASFC